MTIPGGGLGRRPRAPAAGVRELRRAGARSHQQPGMAKARAYGVTRAPSVVVNGRLADCRRQGAVDETVLRELGVGVRI